MTAGQIAKSSRQGGVFDKKKSAFDTRGLRISCVNAKN